MFTLQYYPSEMFEFISLCFVSGFLIKKYLYVNTDSAFHRLANDCFMLYLYSCSVDKHQNLGRTCCKLTRKWKVKINTAVQNEDPNPAFSIFRCFIQGFTCTGWVNRYVSNCPKYHLTTLHSFFYQLYPSQHHNA